MFSKHKGKPLHWIITRRDNSLHHWPSLSGRPTRHPRTQLNYLGVWHQQRRWAPFSRSERRIKSCLRPMIIGWVLLIQWIRLERSSSAAVSGLFVYFLDCRRKYKPTRLKRTPSQTVCLLYYSKQTNHTNKKNPHRYYTSRDSNEPKTELRYN